MTKVPAVPPLAGVRVIELAGLAPAPYCGLLLSLYGASVLRIDVPTSATTPPKPTADLLTHHKSSLPLNLKYPPSHSLFLSLIPHADILIDPYRPFVLSSLSLDPARLQALNPRLIIAHLNGFRRDGKYAAMAGHDINYLAVSGILSLLGRKGERPYAPGNLLADFAGGGGMLFSGILMALLARQTTGRGQVVEGNMVDGMRMLGTFPRLVMEAGGGVWDRSRGENLLDGGCPWYDTYETRDGQYMAVYGCPVFAGALEPKFYTALINGLALSRESIPKAPREDRECWTALRELFTVTFKTRTRKEWEEVFDGTDACVTPVLSVTEGGSGGERPAVNLTGTPGKAVEGMGGLQVGKGGEDILGSWCGWMIGRDWEVDPGTGSCVKLERGKL